MLEAKVISEQYTYARGGVDVITAKKGDTLIGNDAELAVKTGAATALNGESESDTSGNSKAGDHSESDGNGGDEKSPEENGDHPKKPEKTKPASKPKKRK